jgi:pimeloyl-ACP methyl ester carboxylesterase
MQHPHFLERAPKPNIAYFYTTASQELLPIIVFLTGYRSDMTGDKAIAFEKFCQQRGQGFLRFDYSGHGQSGGIFEDGNIGQWTQDAIDIINHTIPKGSNIILVGSSMGGWISCLIARESSQIHAKICGFIGIAAAPDFSRLMWDHRLTEAQKADMNNSGYARLPNPYSANPYYILKKSFFEDGDQQSVFDHPLYLDIAVHLIQGDKDDAVPISRAYALASHIIASGTKISPIIHLLENSDHRLSTPENINYICTIIRDLSESKTDYKPIPTLCPVL